MDEFGRGGRWICECGDFYDAIEGCKKCKNKRMMIIMARRMALNKLNGIPNQSAKKRARKGVNSQIINLFRCGNVEKGQKMLDNLRKKSPGRWGYVKRMIKEVCGQDLS